MDVYDWLSHMDMPTNYKPFNIVEVRFKGSRKEFYVNHENLYLEMGEMVAVEPNTGGYDIGHVSMTGELVRLQLSKNRVDPNSVSKKIYRKVTDADIKKWQAAKDFEWETMHRARKLALDLGLSMKISDVDYQGDKSKATFYYTAEGRVDFRELIKRMAEAFRIRIEMRQIGMRQEASRLGGIGSCGRELCCSTWLTDFKTVSTSAARYQNLSLNTLKLAGQCGKLKCCLNYELDSYMDALRDIPSNIERIETQHGTAFLQKTDIFKKLMWFSYPGEENWMPLTVERVKEVHQLNKEGVKPEELGVVVFESVDEKPASYDYENVVGQDSLTRLDDKNRKKRRSGKGKRKPDGKPDDWSAGKNVSPRPQQQGRSEQKPKGSEQRGRGGEQRSRGPEHKPKGSEQKPKVAEQSGQQPKAADARTSKPKRRSRGNNRRGRPGDAPQAGPANAQ